MITIKKFFYYLGIGLISVLALAVLIQTIWIMVLSKQVGKLKPVNSPGQKMTNSKTDPRTRVFNPDKVNNANMAASNLLETVSFEDIPEVPKIDNGSSDEC